MSAASEPRVEPEATFSACHRRARTSAKKARPVIDLIRNKRVAEARDIVRHVPRRAAVYVDRVLQSAIANAEHGGRVDVDDLVVWRAWVDEGPISRGRWKFAAHGRVRPIQRHTSHIHVELALLPEAPEPPRKPRAEKPAKAEKAEKSEKVEKSEKAAKAAKGEQAAKPDGQKSKE
jgi:large subunit ribosomal protein L22